MAELLKNNKPRVDYEPRSAHGRAVKKKKIRVNLESRLAHGRAVNKNKARVTWLNNVCACARSRGSRWRQWPGHHKNLEKWQL